MIVREPGDVVYINMPIYAMSGRAHGMGPLPSANPLDTDKTSKDKGSAKSRVKSQAKSKTRSKPAVKSLRKAKGSSIRNAGSSQ